MADQKQKEVLELQIPATLKGLIEALVFAAKEPLTAKQMKDIYEGDGPQAFMRQLESDEIEAAVDELNAEYEKGEKPYRIIRIAGGFQFATIASYAGWIGRLYKEQGRRKLSQSGIETLAIIAYKQPVTKADIESIRGVNCDYVLGTLLEKELTTIVGRAHAPGRPLLYGTTREFLKHFGLNEITDLPRPREIEEILGESQFETERRMLEAQAGAETMKEEAQDFKSRLPHIPRKKPGLETSVEIKPRDGQREIKTVQRIDSPEPEVAVPPTSPDFKALAVPVEENSNAVTPDTDGESFKTEVESVDAMVSSSDTIAAPPEVTTELENLKPELPDANAAEAAPVTESRSVPPIEPMKVAEPGESVLREGQPDQPLEQSTAPEAYPPPIPGVAHKSKWQSWKEKVQGFIRKIFG